MERSLTPTAKPIVSSSAFEGAAPQYLVGANSYAPVILTPAIDIPWGPNAIKTDASLPPQSAAHDQPDLGRSPAMGVELVSFSTDPIEGVDYIDEDKPSDQPSISPSDLDAKFTASQLKHMESLKSEYTTATQASRPNITRGVANQFIVDITRDGKELSAEERNVRYWFAQRARTRHYNPKFAPPWSARTVFYKAHVEAVAATQKRMYEAAIGATQTSRTNVIIEEVDLDLVEAVPQKPAKKNGKPIKPFDYLQAAITEEFSKLTRDQQKEYEACASKWRAEGPPPEQKRRVADKSAISYVEGFHLEMFKQMGARIFSFVAYRRPDGKNVVSMVDVNKETGAYHSFSELIRPTLQRSGLYKRWATYSTNVLTRQPDRETAPPARGSIVPLDLTEFKEPRLPKGWRKPPDGQARYKWYQELVRSYVTLTQAAGTRSLIPDYLPTRDQQVRWPHIEHRNDEVFDVDSLSSHPDAGPIKDPGDMNVKPCEHHLSHWEARNNEGLPGLVMRGHVQKDGELVEFPPRRPFKSSDIEEAEERVREEALRRKGELKQKRAASRKAKREQAKDKDADGEDDEGSGRGKGRGKGKGKGKAKAKGKGKGREKEKEIEIEIEKAKQKEKPKGRPSEKGKEKCTEPDAQADAYGSEAEPGELLIRQLAQRSRRPVVHSEDESQDDAAHHAASSGQLGPHLTLNREHTLSPGPLFIPDDQDETWGSPEGFLASIPRDSPLYGAAETPHTPEPGPPPRTLGVDLPRPATYLPGQSAPEPGTPKALLPLGSEVLNNGKHPPVTSTRDAPATQTPSGSLSEQLAPSAPPDDPFIAYPQGGHMNWAHRGPASSTRHHPPTPYPPYATQPHIPNATPPHLLYSPESHQPMHAPYYPPSHTPYVSPLHRAFASHPHHHYPTPPSVSHPPYYQYGFQSHPDQSYAHAGPSGNDPSPSAPIPFPHAFGRPGQQSDLPHNGSAQLAHLLSALVSPTRNLPTALGNMHLQPQQFQPMASTSPSTPLPYPPAATTSVDDDGPKIQTPTKVGQRKGRRPPTSSPMKRGMPSALASDDLQAPPTKRLRLAPSESRPQRSIPQQSGKVRTAKPQAVNRPSDRVEALSGGGTSRLTNARDKQLVEEAKRLTGCSELNYVRSRKAKVRTD